MEGSRIFGLDVLRATAILLVIFWHSYDAITYLAPDFHAPFFLDGVDLFFVLSGYLIGGLLLKGVGRPGRSPWTGLMGFWLRRFLRTLPNYYLFLIINLLLLWAGVSKGLLNHNVLAYFAFLQNVWKPLDLFFWESWSLTVEVWFYLLFPIAVLLCRTMLGIAEVRALWTCMMAFLIAPLMVRMAMAPGIESIFHGELTVRKLVITRMDAILFGVLMALLAHRFPGAWKAWRWPLFLLGLAGTVCAPLLYGEDRLWYSVTWHYTLNALSMSLLLPLLSQWRKVPRGGGAVVFLSLISYALFLVHLPLRSALEPFYDPALPVSGWAQIALYWLLCGALAWLVYRFWEKPFMDMRDGLGARLLGSSKA